MEINFSIHYAKDAVEKDIPLLPSTWKKKIKKAIEEKLTTSPELYGKPLRRSLKGYRKLRVGDYRVIFRIEKKKVLIFLIDHRSKVYTNVLKRIS